MIDSPRNTGRPSRPGSRFNGFVTTTVVGCLLLIACSGPSFSVAVEDVVIGAGNSGELICYVEGKESTPARYRSASYSADGTYQSRNPLADSVTVEIYGRTVAPSPACVAASQDVDVALSDQITLREDVATAVEVGGADYGNQLAEIVSHDSYWIGARISGNYTLLEGEKISLENGRISVTIW